MGQSEDLKGSLQGRALESAKKILERARHDITEAAEGAPGLEFKIRRYVYIRLTYDERGNPLSRKLLKIKKFDEQQGLCAFCEKPLGQISYSHLDRREAPLGYTVANTRLVHADCHHKQQKQKNYK